MNISYDRFVFFLIFLRFIYRLVFKVSLLHIINTKILFTKSVWCRNNNMIHEPTVDRKKIRKGQRSKQVLLHKENR